MFPIPVEVVMTARWWVGLALGAVLWGASDARAASPQAPSAACRALLGRSVDLAALEGALSGGFPADDLCAFEHQGGPELGPEVTAVAVALLPPLAIPLLDMAAKKGSVHHRSLLSIAVGRGSLPATRLLLEHGAHPIHPDRMDVGRPVVAAVQHDLRRGGTTWTDLLLAGDLALPSQYLCDVHDASDPLGRRPDLFEKLVAHGADPRRRDCQRQTPLHHAAAQGDVARVTRLLDEAALDADLRDDWRRTPAQRAAAHGHWDVVAVLHAAGDPLKSPPDSARDLLKAAVKQGSDTGLDLLLEAGLPVGGRHWFGASLAELARAHGHTELEQRLVAAGSPPPKEPDPKDVRAAAVEAALKGGDSDAVVAVAADLPHGEREQLLARLMEAGDREVVARLLDQGATGSVALVRAALGEDREAVAWLRQRGVRYGEGALDHLVPRAHIDHIRTALEDGAAVGGTKLRRDTPAHRAMSKDNREVVVLLAQYGAFESGAPSLTDSPFRSLRFHTPEDVAYVRVLLDAGVPPPLSEVRSAIRTGGQEVVSLLLDHVDATTADLKGLRSTCRRFDVPPEVRAAVEAAIQASKARDRGR
jgi:ankyrin repeat protein